uniref:Hemagglutinin-neuraminidase n=1 Tax=Mus rat paramyxovirus TaxID=3141895 RepID=A0AAU7E4B1_9MONO
MADYYKTGGVIKQPEVKVEKEGSKGPDILAYTSLVLGILSVIVLIALNATNIILSIKRDQGVSSGSGGSTSQPGGGGNRVDQIYSLIESDVLPKTNLINNMVSYQLPSSLNQIYTLIKRDVLLACTPKFDHDGDQCPVSANPFHSGSFSLLSRNFLSRCPNPNDNIALRSDVTLVDFPSFIPGPTKPGGCTRDPSFSIGSKIFGYTHNVVPEGCEETHSTTQYVSIGRITDVNAELPYFETLTQWYIDDGLNRKTCTIVVVDEGAWIACVISAETDEQDYQSNGIGRIFIGYMDIYGRRKYWYLDESSIDFSHNFAAFYFSVGSGIVEDGKVYILAYGGLIAPITGNVMCHAPGCPNPSQETCNNANRPQSRNGRQMVNAIFSFDNDPTSTPAPKVKVLNPGSSWFGSRGRLMNSAYETYAFIYVQSETWHALPQIGMVTLDEDYDLYWVDNVATSRPGARICAFGNRCPEVCLTGVYTDLFPLDSVYQFAITVTLKSFTTYTHPVIQVVSQNAVLYERELISGNQSAQFTTTTCFKYTRSLWCLSIVALEPATVGSRQPVPFLYKLPLYCKSSTYNTGIIVPIFDKSNKTQFLETTELVPPEVPYINSTNVGEGQVPARTTITLPPTKTKETVRTTTQPTTTKTPTHATPGVNKDETPSPSEDTHSNSTPAPTRKTTKREAQSPNEQDTGIESNSTNSRLTKLARRPIIDDVFSDTDLINHKIRSNDRHREMVIIPISGGKTDASGNIENPSSGKIKGKQVRKGHTMNRLVTRGQQKKANKSKEDLESELEETGVLYKALSFLIPIQLDYYNKSSKFISYKEPDYSDGISNIDEDNNLLMPPDTIIIENLG